ncbi:hypothetical protein AAG906_010703 [Vitis piasezkii]
MPHSRPDRRPLRMIMMHSPLLLVAWFQFLMANMKTIENFFVSARGKELLKNASVKISHGKRVIGDDNTALQAVISANEELVRPQKGVASLQNSSAATCDENEYDASGDDVEEKLAELYENLQLSRSDTAEAQVSKILAGLGFTKDMQGHATRSFSGGWRMRISLARALFAQPTLLCLMNPPIILT